jgi:putative transposase
MPRKPRFYHPGVPVHVIQRGNNRRDIFFNPKDYDAYRAWLHEACERYGCRLHAYVFMTNHAHLLLTPKNQDTVSRTLQYLGRRYVPYVNREYRRSGTLWEGRYKASSIDGEKYLLACMRYIELNPVRARMVKSPSAYRYSSYRANASGQADDLITPHSVYSALGRGPAARQEAYRNLFREDLERETLADIRNAWHTGTPLGSGQFVKKIEKALKTKVGYAKRGRPKRPAETE